MIKKIFKKLLQLYRIFLFITGCAAAEGCGAFAVEYPYLPRASGIVGGAIGMGIISGCCFLALSLTFLT